MALRSIGERNSRFPSVLNIISCMTSRRSFSSWRNNISPGSAPTRRIQVAYIIVWHCITCRAVRVRLAASLFGETCGGDRLPGRKAWYRRPCSTGNCATLTDIAWVYSDLSTAEDGKLTFTKRSLHRFRRKLSTAIFLLPTVANGGIAVCKPLFFMLRLVLHRSRVRRWTHVKIIRDLRWSNASLDRIAMVPRDWMKGSDGLGLSFVRRCLAGVVHVTYRRASKTAKPRRQAAQLGNSTEGREATSLMSLTGCPGMRCLWQRLALVLVNRPRSCLLCITPPYGLRAPSARSRPLSCEHAPEAGVAGSGRPAQNDRDRAGCAFSWRPTESQAEIKCKALQAASGVE